MATGSGLKMASLQSLWKDPDDTPAPTAPQPRREMETPHPSAAGSVGSSMQSQMRLAPQQQQQHMQPQQQMQQQQQQPQQQMQQQQQMQHQQQMQYQQQLQQQQQMQQQQQQQMQQRQRGNDLAPYYQQVPQTRGPPPSADESQRYHGGNYRMATEPQQSQPQQMAGRLRNPANPQALKKFGSVEVDNGGRMSILIILVSLGTGLGISFLVLRNINKKKNMPVQEYDVY